MRDEAKVCGMCGQHESFYCRDSDTGELRPMCIDQCGEHAGDPGCYDGRCRDCGIQHQLDEMQCSACKRMRYTHDEKLAPIAASLWGERCKCEPLPPSVAEQPTAPSGEE